MKSLTILNKTIPITIYHPGDQAGFSSTASCVPNRYHCWRRNQEVIPAASSRIPEEEGPSFSMAVLVLAFALSSERKKGYNGHYSQALHTSKTANNGRTVAAFFTSSCRSFRRIVSTRAMSCCSCCSSCFFFFCFPRICS